LAGGEAPRHRLSHMRSVIGLTSAARRLHLPHKTMPNHELGADDMTLDARSKNHQRIHAARNVPYTTTWQSAGALQVGVQVPRGRG
jgi:hypothetical protein